MIRHAKPSDMLSISKIYNHYILSSTATFETEPITTHEMLNRFNKAAVSNLPWLIAESESGEITGYAYACKWRERYAYRFSVEVTVYLSENHTGQGLGSALYHQLFDELNMLGVHAVMAGITLPNQPSVQLHEQFGMSKVAHFSEVGFKFNQWLAVGYWQKLLNTPNKQ